MKFGYQGNCWKDDREMYTNTRACRTRYRRRVRLTSTFTMHAELDHQYANPYFNNARAAMTSFYAQDQWTLNRLTLQGALRYDHPWSWFPAVDQPREPFLPGRHVRAKATA